MKAPDDISEYDPSDDKSDHACYDEAADHSDAFSLSTTGLEESADDDFLKAEEEADGSTYEALATKKTEGSLSDLLVGRNVFLVRHGNTEKAENDQDRMLSPLAERQCSAFLAAYGTQLDRVKYVFSSSTARARETASFLGFPDPAPVPYLNFHNYFTEEMQRVDELVGYAPLSDVYDANEGGGRAMYVPIQAEMSVQLAQALGKELEKAKAMGEYEGDVLIVTHATTISLVALEVLKAIKEGSNASGGTNMDGTKESESSSEDTGSCPEEDKILAMNVGEVQGFSISPEGKVDLLKVE